MRRGMCDVLIDPRGLLLSVYTPLELGTVIGGIQDLDVADWEAHTRYIGVWPAANVFETRTYTTELTPMHITAQPYQQDTTATPRKSVGSGLPCAVWPRGRSAPSCSNSARAPRASPSGGSRGKCVSVECIACEVVIAVRV